MNKLTFEQMLTYKRKGKSLKAGFTPSAFLKLEKITVEFPIETISQEELEIRYK